MDLRVHFEGDWGGLHEFPLPFNCHTRQALAGFLILDRNYFSSPLSFKMGSKLTAPKKPELVHDGAAHSK